MSVNQITLIGNLGKEVKAAGNDANPISNFSVATNHEYKNREGEKVTETEWHRVVAFGQSARFVNNYAQSGRQIYVQGRLRTRSYEKDGKKLYVTEIVAERVEFLGSNPNRDSSERAPQEQRQSQGPAQEQRAPAAASPQAQSQGQQSNDMDDDIPF